MNKFENTDIFASFGAIIRQNTAFYQSDFEIDKQIIQKAAASPAAEDKTLLWLSRPSIRAQLKNDKEKSAPKRAAAKSKNYDLEV